MPSLRKVRHVLVLTLSGAAAAVLPAGAAAAATTQAGSAAPQPGQSLPDVLPDSVSSVLPTQSLTGTLGNAVGPVKHLTLDPLSNTSVDPLDNGVGSQVADFKPVSTAVATDPLTHGGSLATLPLVGTAAGLLPG